MPVKTDNEELTAYAKEICDALEAKDVRVELDDRSEKLGYRMREGQVQKVLPLRSKSICPCAVTMDLT